MNQNLKVKLEEIHYILKYLYSSSLAELIIIESRTSHKCKGELISVGLCSRKKCSLPPLSHSLLEPRLQRIHLENWQDFFSLLQRIIQVCINKCLFMMIKVIHTHYRKLRKWTTINRITFIYHIPTQSNYHKHFGSVPSFHIVL